MKRLWLLIIAVNFILFVSAGSLTPIGYFYEDSNLLGLGLLAINLVALCWMVEFFVDYEEAGLLSGVLFRRIQIEDIRQNARNWLLLHWTIQGAELVTIVLLFATFIVSSAAIHAGSVLIAYSFAWFLLFSMLTFPYFHSVRNFLGMGYDEIEGGSLYGVQAMSRLASILLSAKNERGVGYLSKALYMLDRSLRVKKLSLENLEKAMIMLSVIEETDNKREYNQLKALSENLSQQPLLLNASKALESFVVDDKLSWAVKFNKLKGSKHSWIEVLTVVAVLVTAFATFTQALLPESKKEAVMNWLSQFLTSSNALLIFPIIVLGYVSLRYVLRLDSAYIKLRDIKKIKENGN